MDKDKIAVFFPSMSDGGAERVTLNLIRYLAKTTDYSIDLVLVNATGPFMEQVPESVSVVDLNAGRVLKSIPKLIKYLRAVRPSVLLSGMDYVNIVALVAAKLAHVSTRTVVCLHINLSAQLKNPKVKHGGMVVRLLKWTHPWADVIVATSKGCGEDFKEVTGVGSKNMVTIYNPAITDEIAEKATQAVGHKWLINDSYKVVLAVGRMAHQKNYSLLLKAFNLVKQHHSDARLLILGDGEERVELEQLVHELSLESSVDMPGFVMNPYAYMSKSNVFVLSSHYEALPAVLIEAMYCGAQLVSTDCPNGPNEILLNGRYGQLVPLENEGELADAICEALRNTGFVQDANACDRFLDVNVADQYLEALFPSSS